MHIIWSAFLSSSMWPWLSADFIYPVCMCVCMFMCVSVCVHGRVYKPWHCWHLSHLPLCQSLLWRRACSMHCRVVSSIRVLYLERARAPHSSTLAWRIPGMEEPGRLQSMGSLRVGHDWVTPFTFHFHILGKEMATHSSVLAWRIPGTGEPGGLPSMGSHRVGHDWSDLAAAACPLPDRYW